MEQPSNFLKTLFDFSFSEFLTVKIIKVLYGIGIFFAAIGALGLMVNGFADSFGKGFILLILSPIVFIVYTILIRVWLEVIIVLFKIADNVTEIARAKKE